MVAQDFESSLHFKKMRSFDSVKIKLKLKALKRTFKL
jgi:hypothetical protein